MKQKLYSVMSVMMLLLAWVTPAKANGISQTDILKKEVDLMFGVYVAYYKNVDKQMTESNGEFSDNNNPKDYAGPANYYRTLNKESRYSDLNTAYNMLLSKHPYKNQTSIMKEIAQLILEGNNKSGLSMQIIMFQRDLTAYTVYQSDLAKAKGDIRTIVYGSSGNESENNPSTPVNKETLRLELANCRQELNKHGEKIKDSNGQYLQGAKEYENAIDAAQLTYESADATDLDVSAAVSALKEASQTFAEFIRQLDEEEAAKYNTERVDNKVKEAKKLLDKAKNDPSFGENMLQSPAYMALEIAIEKYAAMLAFDESEADAAIADLAAKMKSLQDYLNNKTNIADTSGLENAVREGEQLIAQAKSKGQGNKANELEALVEQAKAILAKGNPTKQQVETLQQQISDVFNDLKSYLSDYSEATDDTLQQLVGNVKKELEDALKEGYITSDKGKYNEEAAKKLEELIKQVENKLGQGDLTQEDRAELMAEIKKAQESLKGHVQQQKELAANVQDLGNLIAEAEQLLKDALEKGNIAQDANGEYNNEYANKLAELISKAKLMKESGNYKMDELVKLLADIKTVNINLRESITQHTTNNQNNDDKIETNKSKLSTAIANAQAAIDAAEKGWVKYQDGAVAEIKAELAAALAVHQSATTQSDIDNATNKLLSALDAFLSKQVGNAQVSETIAGWRWEGSSLYYYENGVKRTWPGWFKNDNSWYYLKAGGAAAIGWIKDGGVWYYLQSNGQMKTGWLNDGGAWYYLAGSGAMKTGWQKVNGTWYYLKGSGAMATGWIKADSKWYYLKNSGAMASGWVKDDGKWYYHSASGAMQKGWVASGGKWYYLQASGAMAADTKIGSYQVGADGAWVQ